MLSSLFSSAFEAILPTAHAEEAQEVAEVEAPEASEDKEEEGEAEEEEEEEEEPEDPAPAIREACAESKECHAVKHHFEECAARVASGKVLIENEDCVEELFHLMHCVDACAAPKVFAQLK
ncbi:ubiquinol-cytochrome C reductase hinge domain-containing protein [Leucosporidium creatinivorum]|uniref:Ubiquinol-cytochrome C reductase hinge domain-containing protein n=1 Tax=Leucosporidium creatinivorum TaxID=106004 RepID=A0A1Y2G1E0_9BASI|nr:ubiquinol-cytochrome C reductase hinge domain-containing protein [Leucosporidium creatinivorum]